MRSAAVGSDRLGAQSNTGQGTRRLPTSTAAAAELVRLVSAWPSSGPYYRWCSRACVHYRYAGRVVEAPPRKRVWFSSNILSLVVFFGGQLPLPSAFVRTRLDLLPAPYSCHTLTVGALLRFTAVAFSPRQWQPHPRTRGRLRPVKVSAEVFRIRYFSMLYYFWCGCL